jgi:signal transduction histidine kinase/ActR/RegA family two-component response regulator
LELLRALGPRSLIRVSLTIRGRTIGSLSFGRSASSRRYAQRDAQFAEDLAQSVAIAFDNYELLESVRAADRQKDEFLAMLAHELRNPLAAISYANALILKSDPDAQAESVNLVDRQVQNLAHLIDGLLDVSRISQDKIQLRSEPFDGVSVLRRVCEVLRPLIEHKQHEIVVDIQGESIPLFGDVTRFEQIVTNVLSNAVKYTPEGGRISLQASTHEGQVVIRVKDSGIGISSEMLPRIFDLFAQAEQGLDRSQGGLGIGLTIARKLTEIQGGTLTAASAGVGHGSEFTIRLPLAEAVREEINNRDASASTRQLRILVVDDNRDTVEVQSRFLAMLGHEVKVAHDGPAAIAAAEELRPHVVLLDLGLPGMTGYEVAKALRGNGSAGQLLIAISGYGRPEDKQRCREVGFDHHFTKPVDQRALTALLDAFDEEEGG